MRLAFSTNAFKATTLEQAVDVIAAIGYRGIEIMADVPHAYPPQMDESRRTDLRRQLDRLHLSVSNINAFTLFARGDTYHPTWIENDADQREIRIMHTLACIELADCLGARTISLQPGGPLIGTGLSRPEASRRFAEGLRRVLPAAQKLNVTLAIEPEPGLFIESAAEYMAFKNEFFANEPLVRMNCDIGHLYCVGEDPATTVGRMPQEIAHVHLEDIAATRVHQHLVPGRGAIDFAALFTALDRIEYKGWVTVELYPYESTAAEVAKAAYDFLMPRV